MNIGYEAPPKNDFMIMGYTVEFPDGKKPFAAQFAVMNKVLLALKKEQNALLESPTGSGKTLALLCSSLAWQRSHAEEVNKRNRANLDAFVAAKVQEAQAKAARDIEAAKAAAELRLAPHDLIDPTQSSQVPQPQDAEHPLRVPNLHVLDEQQLLEETDRVNSALMEPDRFSDAERSQKEYELACMMLRADKLRGGNANRITLQFQGRQPKTFMVNEASGLVQPLVTPKTEPVQAPPPATPASIKTDDDDDDFISFSQLQKQQPKARPESKYGARFPPESPEPERKRPASAQPSDVDAVRLKQDAAPPAVAPAPQTIDSVKKEKVPQIYFCSRTHSQLAQVVQELKKCPFAGRIKMTLLGSKKHYCVHPRVRNLDAGKLADECSELMDEMKCKFQTKGKQRNEIRQHAPPVWDIEDMVALGDELKECPYFFARSQGEFAEIVFCPYNYIIDPQIRSSCSIDLKNAVVIFDEAHNIEDVCRDAASLELHYPSLEESAVILTTAIQNPKVSDSKKGDVKALLKLINGWKRWLTHVKPTLKPMGFEYETRQFSGPDAAAILGEYCGLTPQTLDVFKMAMEAVMTEENIPSGELGEEPPTKLKLGMATIMALSSILNVADYLFRGSMKYVNDFKLAAVRQRGFGRRSNEWEYKACVWCLYAGVAFSDITSQTRSVILTSGTLSPMTSFAGELGTTFPITLEANHVVNMQKQVWLGSLVQGPPKHRDFSATYANQQDLTYQDALGDIVLNLCRIVPGGILVFLPSYRFMQLLYDRWMVTGAMAKMEEKKTSFVEPRGAGKDFDALLEDFKSAIEASRQPNATKTGALFFAVFRGKVSEGIDFSNDNARAVVVVGIPFPNIKEQQIALKQQYQNDRSQYDKACAPGRVWYEHQAFRALNQALGRCIRHRMDYGAIFLVDSRYRNERYTNQLSKWTRGHCQEYEVAEEALEHVTEFFGRVGSDPELQSHVQAANKAAPVEPTVRKIPKVAKPTSGWKPKKPKTMMSFFPHAN